MPIGHSVDATPLQMAAAYAAIANDGTYVQPHLIKEVIGAGRQADPGRRRRSPGRCSARPNAAALRTMLEAVTTVDGARPATGRPRIPGYRVAGKTGTGLRYVDGKRQPGEVASFIGMAPAENPRYVVAVFVVEPRRRGRRRRRAGVPGDDGLHPAPLPGAAVGDQQSPKFEVFPR